jgi:hypothetical protein
VKSEGGQQAEDHVQGWVEIPAFDRCSEEKENLFSRRRFGSAFCLASESHVGRDQAEWQRLSAV